MPAMSNGRRFRPCPVSPIALLLLAAVRQAAAATSTTTTTTLTFDDTCEKKYNIKVPKALPVQDECIHKLFFENVKAAAKGAMTLTLKDAPPRDFPITSRMTKIGSTAVDIGYALDPTDNRTLKLSAALPRDVADGAPATFGTKRGCKGPGAGLTTPWEPLGAFATERSRICRSGAKTGKACTTDDTSGTTGCGTGATCPGCCVADVGGATSDLMWPFQTSGKARLYRYHDGDTVCWYLYRGDGTPPLDNFGNGTLCFNSQTCAVCALDTKDDLALVRPTWAQLTPARGLNARECRSGARRGMACTTDDTDAATGCGAGAACPGCCVISAQACWKCHAAGTVSAKAPFFDHTRFQQPRMGTLNATCAKI